MNLEELKINGTNNITITNSLKAPLLKLSIKNTGAQAAESNDLIISVAKSETDESPNSYTFSLTSPLELNETFVIEPCIRNDRVSMKAAVYRADGSIEDVEYESIILEEGTNFLTTNYVITEIEAIYPKDIELVKLFLNNVIYALNTENKVLSLDDIYFKDCFTDVDGKINASFNRLTVKCFNSENGNFSMDCDGNLVVNSIIARDGSVGGSEENQGITFDDVYPVGSIYMSVNSTNPSSLFGGSWEQISNRFLLAAGSSYAAGSTGGEASVKLSTNQIPAHSHSASTGGAGGHSHTTGTLEVRSAKNTTYGLSYTRDLARPVGSSADHTDVTITNTVSNHTHSVSVNNTGGGASHNNMPPYLAVYIWKRTA